MWPLFSCARVCLTVHALVGPSIRPNILVVVLCACVRACVPVRVYLFVKPLYALVRCACGACERGFGVFAVRVCVSVRVHVFVRVCTFVHVCWKSTLNLHTAGVCQLVVCTRLYV